MTEDDARRCDKDAKKPEDVWSTARMIRVYRSGGSERVRLIQRLDWEVVGGHNNLGELAWVDSTKQYDSLLRAATSPSTMPVAPNAIVIKDLLKGVVCEGMIKWLVEQYGHFRPRWYISSKKWQPRWLNTLRETGQDVRILVVPQVAAEEAVRQKTVGAWTIAEGLPSSKALACIEKLDVAVKRPKGGIADHPRLIVALPDGMRVVAKSTESSGDSNLYVAQDPGREPYHVGVPMASVLFSALVGLDLHDEAARPLHKELLCKAMAFTRSWMQHESGRIQSAATWEPSREPALRSFFDPQHPSTSSSILSLRWDRECELWDEARDPEGFGILKSAHSPRIDLWRAMTDVDEYVALVPNKRESIKELKRQMETFKKVRPERNVSMMLIAEPGSGKTHLMSRLARAMGFKLMPFNITQLLSKTDLLDCFDTIASEQASMHPDTPFMVFFDEINSMLGNSAVFDTFLDPLDQRTYIRAGKKFHLRPCVWVFAGTGINRQNRETKASDFVSRLTTPPMEFNDSEQRILTREERTTATLPPRGSRKRHVLADLERVYVGTSLVKSIFSEVRSISDHVLSLFKNLRPDVTLREQERMIRTFRNIRQTAIWASNVPNDIVVDHCTRDFLATWKSWEHGRVKRATEMQVHIGLRPSDSSEYTNREPDARIVRIDRRRSSSSETVQLSS